MLLSHSTRYGDVQVIVSRFYCNSKWLPRINLIFFVGAITVRDYSHFTITFLTIWRCAGDYGFAEIQNGRHGSTLSFLWVQKLVRNYSNFTITFPTIWRFAGDFSKVLLKYKMVAMDKLNNVLWAQKLKSEIIQILHITHHLEMCR